MAANRSSRVIVPSAGVSPQQSQSPSHKTGNEQRGIEFVVPAGTFAPSTIVRTLLFPSESLDTRMSDIYQPSVIHWTRRVIVLVRGVRPVLRSFEAAKIALPEGGDHEQLIG